MASPIPMTPTIDASGTYQVTSPFALVPNTIYTCRAIRAFQDLIADGVDIAKTYYLPVGLTATNYADDAAVNANIITLMSATAPTVYIPDTYIASFPDMSNVAYSTIVFGVSAGPLPDSLDLTATQTAIQSAVSDLIGVSPTVTIFSVPSDSVMTQAEATTAESARQAAITNRTTDHAALLALQGKYATLLQQYQALEAVLVATGTVPVVGVASADGTKASYLFAVSGLTLTFTDKSTAGAGVTLSTWSWNFGDGSAANTAESPSHTYTAAGTYTVTLTVTDSSGQTATAQTNIQVA